ncbi:hypothetical protein [uncultured Tessaracoccus sp.]|uniref:hypothetical protein n=1 Tax=uncultured Tessaracoccus sp. TaxID=905023 RepID=UPI0025D75D2C|nr:hypothetical protein [uncultured Tessaracoccus sp.]
MSITSAAAHAIIDALPPRLQRRAEQLLAARRWTVDGNVHRFGGATVVVAGATVREPGAITCDCLLAPSCAHRAAVAMSLKLVVDDAPGDSDQPLHPSRRPAPPATAISAAGLAVVARTRADLVTALTTGWARLPLRTRSRLLTDLTMLRAAQLTTAERALTALLTSATTAGRRQACTALVDSLHRLELGDATAVSVARRRYTAVTGLSLHPVAAEPVVTDSGFAGVVVHVADADGRRWELNRVAPGADPRDRYLRPLGLGDAGGTPFDWSRHRSLVARGTASADGRLGGGESAQTSLGDVATWWDVLPEGHATVDGTVTGGDRTQLEVDGTALLLSDTARQCKAGLGTELIGQARGAAVRALVRGTTLLGLHPLDATITMPEQLLGVWWPGLDAVTRTWVGEVDVPRIAPVDPTSWHGTPPSVATVLDRWLERALEGGQAAVRGDLLRRDAAWLVRAGAPFAAELLTNLQAATTCGSRRFDGTWEPDPHPFFEAWLALSQY